MQEVDRDWSGDLEKTCEDLLRRVLERFWRRGPCSTAGRASFGLNTYINRSIMPSLHDLVTRKLRRMRAPVARYGRSGIAVHTKKISIVVTCSSSPTAVADGGFYPRLLIIVNKRTSHARPSREVCSKARSI